MSSASYDNRRSSDESPAAIDAEFDDGRYIAGGDLLFEDSRQAETLVQTADEMQRPLLFLIVFLTAVIIRPWDFVPGLASIKPVTLAILGILLSVNLANIKLKYFELPLAKPLLFLWLTMLATVATSYWFSFSIDYTVKWFQFLLLFSFVGTLVVSADGLFRLTRAMTYVGGLLSLVAIKAKLTMQVSAEGRIEGVGEGFLSDPNELAQALVAVLPFAWWIVVRHRNSLDRMIGLGCGMLLLIGIVVTESRGGLLSMLAAGGIILVLSSMPMAKKLAIVGLVGIAGIAALPSSITDRYSTISSAANTDESAQTRLAVWQAGQQMFADHFIQGTGIGTFEIVYGMHYIDHKFAGDKWYSAHNSIVEAAVELGVFGVTFWLIFVGMPFLLLWRARSKLLAIDDDESPTRESLLVWLECMLAAWAGFMVGAMFLSKGFDIPVVMFVSLGVAGSELANRWVETYEDAVDEDNAFRAASS